MKYAFQTIDVFSSTPFSGNQLAVLPDAAGISTEGMQKIAREFNFGETTFVLPKNDSANKLSGAHLYTSGGARFCGTSLGRHSLCSDGSRFAGAAESKNAALRPAFAVTSSTSRLVT